MCGTDPGRPPSRRSTAVPRLMLVAVLTGETCELPYRSPSFVDRRSSSRSPGHTFLERVSSDSAVPPFPAGPPIHPGPRWFVRNHNHRTPWSRRHRSKWANVPAFLNESFIFHMPASRSRRVAPRTPPSPPGPADPLLPHPLRARKSHDRLPDPTPPEHQPTQTRKRRAPSRSAGRATASSAGRGRRARDTPSRRGDPGFGGLPLLHEKTQQRRPHPSPPSNGSAAHHANPAAARRSGLRPRALPLPGSGTSAAPAPRSVRAMPPQGGPRPDTGRTRRLPLHRPRMPSVSRPYGPKNEGTGENR